MRFLCPNFCLLLLVSSVGLMLGGCSLSQFSEPSTASSVLPAISGKVHGGQQPISGSTIQIYAANTTVSKGASTALLGSPVLTNASGGFSIGAGAYTCPTPGTLVYLVATGGNPGLPGSVNNAAIALMVVLGTCNSLSTDAFVTVNELTTVAAVEALAPFMADGAHVGSDVGNPGGLAGAFATAASMVNFATGQLQTAAGVTQPTALLDTLADILAACVNSAGRSSTPCGVLRNYAGLGGSPDTLTAMLLIVQYPSENVAQLFGLSSASGPFQPTLGSAPANFSATQIITLPIPATGYPFAGFPQIAVDSQQHVWVSVPAVTAALPFIPGSILIYDNEGALITTIASGVGGLFNPLELTPDPFGNMWVLNTVNPLLTGLHAVSLVKFNSTGVPSLSNGPFFPGASNNGSAIYHSISVDTSGNVWVIGGSTPGGTGCYSEYDNNGNNITPTAHFCPQNVTFHGYSIANDESGNTYLAGLNTGTQNVYSVYKIAPNGALLSPANGYTSAGFNSFTTQLLYDRANKELWGVAEPLSGGAGLGAIRPDGTVVFSDPLDGSLSAMIGAALDGSGEMWLCGGSTLFGKFAPDGTNQTNINGGMAAPATYNMAIDSSGNVWATNYTTLYKVVGVASPKAYQ